MEQITEMFKPFLKKQNGRRFKLLTVIVGLIFLLTIWLYYKSETISWFLSALGRLALIKILPYWDWTPLYNSKCLIQKELTTLTKPNQQVLPALGRFETEAENCMLCENVAHIFAISNTTYSQLETFYLERGLPVIITDSHQSSTLKDLLAILQNDATDVLSSQPCDLATNIMLKKLFNLEMAFQKIQNGYVPQNWFLQLRNCQFKAVKASRIFVQRPYFYPLHLEPFYTSWLLISHDYDLDFQRLYLQGLIFVQQLSGNFNIKLQPKEPCNVACPVININLKAGESLVFSTDIWIFNYGAKSNEDNVTAMATILEIDWQF